MLAAAFLVCFGESLSVLLNLNFILIDSYTVVVTSSLMVLGTLTFHKNDFTGTIPTQLGQLTSLSKYDNFAVECYFVAPFHFYETSCGSAQSHTCPLI